MQPIFDAIFALVNFLNANWKAIVDAVSAIAGQLFILWAIVQAGLPLLYKVWEAIVSVLDFGSDVKEEVSARLAGEPKKK